MSEDENSTESESGSGSGGDDVVAGGLPPGGAEISPVNIEDELRVVSWLRDERDRFTRTARYSGRS